MKKEDVIGRTYGMLTVLAEADRSGKTRRVFCRCACGTEKVVQLGHLRQGSTKSCGCYSREVARLGRRKHGLFVGKADQPNEARTRLYRIWANMLQRCENPRNPSHRRYGARGITVCEGWHDFAAFRAWAMANGYQPTLTIDRIDNDVGYEPNNCRWATYRQQRLNQSDVYRIPIGGRVLTLAEASHTLGVSRQALRKSVRRLGVRQSVQRFQGRNHDSSQENQR